MKKKARGFSLLELMIAVIAVGIVATVLLNRLFYYQELAEKAEMEYTIGAVKSALRLRVAELMVSGHAQDAARLADQNPMDWLEQQPRNYLGYLPASASAGIVPGSWYFDPRTRSLVYFPKRVAHLAVLHSDDKRIRWELQFVHNQESGQSPQNKNDSRDGVVIKLSNSYRWF